jgi:hypothetical protein
MTLPRRAVLLGALAPLASTPPSLADDAISPAILELRRFIALARAAVTTELDLEGQPGYAEACAKTEALEREITARAASISARSPGTVEDVIARAEVAGYWAPRDARNRIIGLEAPHVADRAMPELLRAALVMAGHRDV